MSSLLAWLAAASFCVQPLLKQRPLSAFSTSATSHSFRPQVEAGALELAVKRRLQAERRRSPKRVSTSCRADAVNRQSSLSMGKASRDGRERRQSWKAHSSDAIDSALDILFGGEQHQVLDR